MNTQETWADRVIRGSRKLFEETQPERPFLMTLVIDVVNALKAIGRKVK
jgi:hypothetical protein